jgi:hypothetical protein
MRRFNVKGYILISNRSFALPAAAALLAACAEQGGTETAQAAFIDPHDHGAVPDDGLDDRPGIQAAIDLACAKGGGDVVLGPGTWDVTRSPPGTYNHFAALSVHCARVSLRGAGVNATRLKMSGDMLSRTAYVISLDPGVDRISLSDFTIDTAATFHQDEQSHAIAIGTAVCAGALCTTPVSNVTVERIDFVHPLGTDGSKKGDCVRVAGNTPELEARNIKLLDLNFLSCARSGYAGQRNANEVTVSRCFFDGDHIGGTMADNEATGGGWSRGFVFTDNTLVRTLPGGDTYGLSLTSQTHFVVSNNVFIGRGMDVYRGTDGQVSNNVFDATDQLLEPGVIDVGNVAERIQITNNSIRRRGLRGALVKVRPASGGFATGLVIAGNTGSNETEGATIHLDSASDAVISDNALQGNRGPNAIGIYVQAGGRPADGISISGNVLDGFGYAGIRLDPGPSPIAAALVVGNTSRNSGPGLRCDDPGLWSAGSLTAGLNSWSTPQACAPAGP